MQLPKILGFICLILHFNKADITLHSCGENAFCVPYYFCKEEEPFNKTFNGRLSDDHIYCKFLEVCCPQYLITNSNDLDLKNQIDSKLNQIYPNNKRKCGLRNKNGVLFNIHETTDVETQFGEFPWMIAILYEVYDNESDNHLFLYKCGGSLIHPSVILTAAHCVMDEEDKNLFARAGEWDSQTKNEILQSEDRKIVEVLIHNQFDRSFLYFDIALLFTESPYNISPLSHINTVCLPPPQMKFIYKNCFATGWGQAKFGEKFLYSTILKKVNLSIKSLQYCEEQLQGSTLQNYFKLHETFICATGGNNTNTCFGDGGSPLSCPIDDEENYYYQSGIVAWGTGCKGTDPGFYVNIAYLRSWIDYIFAKRELDHSYYTK